MRIKSKLEWGQYVSPLSDRLLPPFNWYSFKHRFSSGLAEKIFSSFSLKKGDTVFDPFCGGGTTLIKAKIDGYNAFGLDISPFSVFLTNTITHSFTSKKLKLAVKKISHRINERVNIPDIELLKKSFSDSALKYIYSLKESILSLGYPESDFFLLCLLSILNSVSKAKKSGGFLRITNQRKASISVIKKAFTETVIKLINDVENLNFNGNTTKAFVGDARNYPNLLKNKSFDAILTSPPYPNRHDYTRIYELELLVGFLDDNKSLKLLRYNTLRSHVEAKKRFSAEGYAIPVLLESLLQKLKERELNNKKIVSTLEGYFEDMFLSLREMSGVLKNKGKVGVVVSNVRFAGITIPVDELLSEIGQQVGLKRRNIYVLRYRGNSAQQMRKYKRVPVRESLVVWQK